MNAITVKDLSIKFLTGSFKSIGLKDYFIQKIKRTYRVDEFWANKDITFTLEKGDMLGIVGTNGAGKSTFLKAVSDIIKPTEGSIKVNGRVAALLELAAGFDQELTVKENTYLRGAILGYTRSFLNKNYKEIIQFAELEKFEDYQFKNLSSGMKSRLAFSIASQVNPDILILDEVLAVGDGAFRKKSEEKMKSILEKDVTVILVSHSLPQIRQMCNKVLWLHKGKQIAFGETKEICDQYQDFLNGDYNEKTNINDYNSEL